MEIKYTPQFIKELNKIKNKDVRASVIDKAEIIEKVGIYKMQATNDATYIKQHDLYEIRIGKKSRNYRILCTVENSFCWLLHLFFKKTQQLSLKELKTAIFRKKLI